MLGKAYLGPFALALAAATPSQEKLLIGSTTTVALCTSRPTNMVSFIRLVLHV